VCELDRATGVPLLGGSRGVVGAIESFGDDDGVPVDDNLGWPDPRPFIESKSKGPRGSESYSFSEKSRASMRGEGGMTVTTGLVESGVLLRVVL
jgi:hypothetical protein